MGIVELIATTGFRSAYRDLLAAGHPDPDHPRSDFGRVVEPNVEAYLLDEVIDYRLLHAMRIEARAHRRRP